MKIQCCFFIFIFLIQFFYSQVIYDRYYKVDSDNDGGSLKQVRNCIQHKNIETKVTKNYRADAEFFDLVVDAHVVSACMVYGEINDITEKPVSLSQDVENMKHIA